MRVTGEVAAGAAVWVSEHIDARPREGIVIHAGNHAVYFACGADVFGIVSKHATAVPLALVTPLANLAGLGARGTALRHGDRVRLGGGRLRTPGANVRIGRYLDYRMPRFRADHAAEMRERLLATGPLGTGELPAPVLAELTASPAAALPLVLGRGSGLTPYGDDVVCGLLAALIGAQDPCAQVLAAHVNELASRRTTCVSSALLQRAAAGEVLVEFARLVASLMRASLALTEHIRRVRRIGHTSGEGLLEGLHLGLAHIVMRKCS